MQLVSLSATQRIELPIVSMFHLDPGGMVMTLVTVSVMGGRVLVSSLPLTLTWVTM